jgi:hypothetical protein
MISKLQIFTLLTILLMLNQYLRAQSVGIGTTSPDSSAMLDITSTTRGLLLPRMTTVQMNAISSPAAGLAIYNTDSSTICVYMGSGWHKIVLGNATINETDPKVGTLTTRYIPKWGGAALTNGLLYDDGTHLMTGTTNAQYGNNFNFSGLTIAATTTSNSDINLLNTEGAKFASYLNFGKGRGGSLTSPSAVQNDDQLMVITANGYSGASYLSSATIQCDVDGTPTTNSVPGRLVFNTTQAGNQGSVERMRITSTGNVGIGTTTPAKKLEVNGTAKTDSLQAVNLRMTNGASNGYVLRSDASGNGTWTALPSAITAGTGLSWSGNTLNSLWTASGNNIYKNNSANVGIGTSSPSAALHVTYATNNNTEAMPAFILDNPDGGTQTSMQFAIGGMERGRIRADASGSMAYSITGSGAHYFKGNGDLNDLAVITNAGRMGIGTNSPAALLHVYNASGNTAINVQSVSNNAYLNLNAGLNAVEASVAAFTEGSQRWSFGKSNTAESGSDAGSDFFINRYNDAAVFQSQPVVIKRSTGFVGINQGSPGQQLDVNGNVNISSANGYYIGSAKVLSINGTDNLFAGVSAGANNAGSSNTFIGKTAGQSNTAGDDNTALGYAALSGNTTGSFNTAIGAGAGTLASGSGNVLIGQGAGFSAGSGNVMIGLGAGGSESGDNKLYIDNSSASSPLVYGDFSKDSLSVNGSLNIAGTMGLKVKTSQAAGTNNPDNTSSIWIYTSGTGTISLPAASACTSRVYTIVNETGANRTISSYRNLTNTATTSIANGSSIDIISDGTSWWQIR